MRGVRGNVSEELLKFLRKLKKIQKNIWRGGGGQVGVGLDVIEELKFL